MSEVNVSLIPYIDQETQEETTCLRIDDGVFEGTLITIDQLDIDENNHLKTDYTILHLTAPRTDENLNLLDQIVTETAFTLLEEFQNLNEQS